MLPRQDSNLDRPAQNRLCYQLHHGAIDLLGLREGI